MIELTFWTVWAVTYAFYKLHCVEGIPVLPEDMSLEYMRVLMDAGIRGRKELQFLGVRHKTLLLHYPLELAKRKRLFVALREEKKKALIEEQRELRRKQREQLRDEMNRKALEKLEHDIEMRQARESVQDYYFKKII